jgi:twitching motility protein PilT
MKKVVKDQTSLDEVLRECQKHPFICTSGITFMANQHPLWERDREIIEMVGYEKLTHENIKEIAMLLGYKSYMIGREEIDQEEIPEFKCLSYEDPEIGRYRVTLAPCEDSLMINLRAIPKRVKSFGELNLPKVAMASLAQLRKGLILITGPTGQGKTTTISAMIRYIKEYGHEKLHISTIEDPIEYRYGDLKPLISQREVGKHVKSYSEGVYQALRMNPHIMVCGEIRNKESLEAVLQASESGHLILSSIHTPDAISTLGYIIERHGKEGVRQRLAYNLRAIVSQQLIDHDHDWIVPNMMPIIEMLYVSEHVKQNILNNDLESIRAYMEKDGKTAQKYFANFDKVENKTSIGVEEKSQFDRAIAWGKEATTQEVNSWTFDRYLAHLYEQKVLCLENAVAYSRDPGQMRKKLTIETTSAN